MSMSDEEKRLAALAEVKEGLVKCESMDEMAEYCLKIGSQAFNTGKEIGARSILVTLTNQLIKAADALDAPKDVSKD